MVTHNTTMRLVLSVILLALTQTGFSQRAIPELWGHRIHDEAGVLHQQTIDSLEHMLTIHEDSTGNQIAVLVIPSLDGDVLEEYSFRVANDKWKLGKKGNDNGVLLLVVIDDRKVRIEVGQGLEGPLPDAVANQIIRNEIAPQFRKGNYDAGIAAGVHAIVKAVQNEYTAPSLDDGLNEIPWWLRLIIGVFVFFVLGAFTFVGLFIRGWVGWLLYVFLIPFYATFPIIVLGVMGGLILLAIYVVIFPILKLTLAGTSLGTRMATSLAGSNSGAGWTSHSSGGFGGWSWGVRGSSGGVRRSSGRSFSGGGGRFGGGGSSGSW
jgi:Beta-propeller domains of methanol dehydrogenase type